MDWDTFVGGHVARTGTHADVDLQAEFNRDVKHAAATALATTKPGEGVNPLDKNNPWAFFDHYIDGVAAQCVNTLTPKWSTRLAAFDVYPVASWMRGGKYYHQETTEDPAQAEEHTDPVDRAAHEGAAQPRKAAA